MKLFCWRRSKLNSSILKIRNESFTHYIKSNMNLILSIILIILDVVVFLIHTVALTLLIFLKQSNVKGSQKLLLIALCSTELTYAIIDIGFVCNTLVDKIWTLSIVCIVLQSATVSVFHTWIMTMIAIDRFLEIYLNIKYNIYWSAKKTKITLIIGLVICLLSFIPLFMVAMRNIEFCVKVIAGYIFPMLSLFFLVVVSFSYFYIIKLVSTHRKNAKRMQKQFQGNNKTFLNKQSSNNFKLFVPTLIIITYLLFMICPNLMKLFNALGLLPFVSLFFAHIFILLRFIADAFIYIFNVKVVRQAFRSVIWQPNSVYPTSLILRKFSRNWKREILLFRGREQA